MRSQDGFAKTAIAIDCAFRNAFAMELEEIRKGLSKPGKSQRGLAKALNVDDAAISRLLKGTRELKQREVPIIRAYLESPEDEVPPVRELREAPATHDFGTYPKDVPILGVAIGGSEGDFVINTGTPADYAPRPTAIARAKHVFALYVQGTSMSRWREPGSLVYVDPIRPPRPGNRVVVELNPEREGEGHPAFLKELVTRTGTKLRLRQYNPESTIEIPLTRIRAVQRVIEWEELLGL